MKIPDDIRRTLEDVADKVVEGGKNLGNQAQHMTSIKRLQIEHAKRIHELGKNTYAWYQSGKMIVTGPVPSEVSALCAKIAELQGEIDEAQRKLDEAKSDNQVKFLSSDDDTSTTPPATPPSTPPSGSGT